MEKEIIIMDPEKNYTAEDLEKYNNLSNKENFPETPYDLQSMVFFGALFFGIATLAKVFEPIWGDYIRDNKWPTMLAIDYTVIIQVTSVVFGTIGLHWAYLENFLEYEISPIAIYHIFIPILVFYMAFCSEDDIFGGTLTQVAWFVLPTCIFTLLFSTLASYALPEINQIQDKSIMITLCIICGAIMATTSPESTIGIMRQLGDTHNIGSILEAENLIVNSIALLLFEALMEILDLEVNDGRTSGALEVTYVILGYTFAPFLLGLLCARAASCYLSNIYHDPISEITITISSIFLIYTGATQCHLSGVLTVGVYGVYLKKWQCTYQDVDFLNKFMGILNFLVRTLIFVAAGLVVTNFFDVLNFYYILWAFYLWGILLVVRFFSLFITTLIMGTNGVMKGRLTEKLKNVFIITWGGLKGAVGLAMGLYLNQLAIFIRLQWQESGRREGEISNLDNKILDAFDKIMLYNAFQVFITMIINANSIEMLAGGLGLLKVTENAENAMRYVVGIMKRFREDSIFVLQNDMFHSEAHWKIVRRMTKVVNPYEKYRAKYVPQDLVESEGDSDFDDNRALDNDEFENFKRFQENNKTDKYHSFQDYSYDMSRKRFMRSLRLAFGKNYKKGYFEDAETRVLIKAAEETEDKRGVFVHPDMLRKNWEISEDTSSAQRKVEGYFVRNCTTRLYSTEYKGKFRTILLGMISRPLFQATIELFVFLNLIPLIYTFLFDVKEAASNELGYFLIVDCLFVFIYFVEIVIKMIVYGREFYHHWENWALVLILLFCTADIAFILVHTRSNYNDPNYWRIILLVIRNLRVLRICYIAVKYGCIITLEVLNGRVRKAYNVGKGFIKAEAELVKDAGSIIDDERVKKFLDMKYRHDRIQVSGELEYLERRHSRQILSIKTKHACRHMLNRIGDLLNELRGAGVLDRGEQDILNAIVQAKHKQVSNFTLALDPTTPKQFLASIEWIQSSPYLVEFMLKNAEIKEFEAHDVLMMESQPQDGIYIVLSGLVEVMNRNASELMKLRSKGDMPEHEEDDEEADEIQMQEAQKKYEASQNEQRDSKRVVIGSGSVLGEVGVLTNAPRTATIVAATKVKVMHINATAAAEAMQKFPAEKEKLWKVIAARMLLNEFMNTKFYKDFPAFDVMLHIKKGDLIFLEKGKVERYEMRREAEEMSVVYGVVNFYQRKKVDTGLPGQERKREKKASRLKKKEPEEGQEKQDEEKPEGEETPEGEEVAEGEVKAVKSATSKDADEEDEYYEEEEDIFDYEAGQTFVGPGLIPYAAGAIVLQSTDDLKFAVLIKSKKMKPATDTF